MTPFAYDRAPNLAAAVPSRARHRSNGASDTGADFFAGDTDTIQLMREGLHNPDRVVDITASPGLDRIKDRGFYVRLGALVRMSDAAEHTLVRDHYPVVSEALLASASAQVRNLATLRDNLLQRTRCGFYREPGFPCNKRVYR